MENEINYKKNLFWNMFASGVNAAEAVIIIIVASRVNDISEVGALSIAFSLANLFMVFGKFGIKNYQVAHDGFDVSFESFLRLRIVTVIMMVLALAGYLFYNIYAGKYTISKAIIVTGVCIWYSIEAFEDVFVAHMQTKGKLYVGNKVFITRWCLIFVSLIATDIMTRNLILSLVVADITALATEVFCITYLCRKHGMEGDGVSVGVLKLLITNVPLCISQVSYFYMTNVSKFVIDRKMDDVAQAIYGYISVPVFVISLINSIIYQPLLMGYVMDIREGRIEALTKKIIRQVLVIAMVMLVCLTGAYLIGIQVISLLYGIDLYEYKSLMLLLLTGGGALAVGGFLETILVIMNKRKTTMLVYLVVCVFSTVITVIMVNLYSLKGAVYGYLFTMCMMALLFIVTLVASLRKIAQDSHKNGE